jgi:hypothetical protein
MEVHDVTREPAAIGMKMLRHVPVAPAATCRIASLDAGVTVEATIESHDIMVSALQVFPPHVATDRLVGREPFLNDTPDRLW